MTKTSFDVLTFEEIIKEILNQLMLIDVNFWLIEESCLDCIRYEKLKIDTLKIGTDSKKNKDILEHSLFFSVFYEFIKKRIKVNIEVDEKTTQTKVMNFHNKSVNVPFPVIDYLRRLYGYDWQNKKVL